MYQQMLHFACLLSSAAYIFITSVNMFEGLGFRLRLGCGALSALCTWLLLRVWFLFACFLVLCFFALWLGCAARFPFLVSFPHLDYQTRPAYLYAGRVGRGLFLYV